MARQSFAAILVLSILANAFSAPSLPRRTSRAAGDVETSNDIEEISITNNSPATQISSIATVAPDPYDDDDDDDDIEFGGSETSSSNGGSNIFSILKIVSALIPGSSSAAVKNFIRKYLVGKHTVAPIHRRLKLENDIEINEVSNANPQFQKQDAKDENVSPSSESGTEDSEENVAEEESMETNGARDASKQDSNSNIDSGDDSDYDEPPGGGDGAGGGILGLLAGLSGGEDGQSDLGSLLATFSGIIANLSGDGIDLNSLIASGIGLFVGLLSEGEENPGAVIASYLLTSLDTITGGGAKNNGEFFGTFLSKLVKGTSAGGDPEASSEENGKEPMADSAGFFSSLLLALLGDMSKSSSGGSSKPWR